MCSSTWPRGARARAPRGRPLARPACDDLSKLPRARSYCLAALLHDGQRMRIMGTAGACICSAGGLTRPGPRQQAGHGKLCSAHGCGPAWPSAGPAPDNNTRRPGAAQGLQHCGRARGGAAHGRRARAVPGAGLRAAALGRGGRGEPLGPRCLLALAPFACAASIVPSWCVLGSSTGGRCTACCRACCSRESP